MSSFTDKVKGAANEAAGNIKQGVGNLTGDEKLKAEGKAQELKGEAQRTVGDAKEGIKNAADTVKSKL
ncbi:CsbD family protein [Methylobacterium sp. 4-46]|uniref:CsbD family protein n=1 Tax=unclassified Methylobacterium TaxID=2615210 RepID=UPI000152E3FB|nr:MULTISPECIES: CsbD family protein [Methylobacterium]ACA18842.1 CsbD family protein [Methylobacterium sp. 4-46]WFT78068.1 CsbD family protein [Methylobacterium nodulans]